MSHERTVRCCWGPERGACALGMEVWFLEEMAQAGLWRAKKEESLGTTCEEEEDETTLWAERSHWEKRIRRERQAHGAEHEGCTCAGYRACLHPPSSGNQQKCCYESVFSRLLWIPRSITLWNSKAAKYIHKGKGSIFFPPLLYPGPAAEWMNTTPQARQFSANQFTC